MFSDEPETLKSASNIKLRIATLSDLTELRSICIETNYVKWKSLYHQELLEYYIVTKFNEDKIKNSLMNKKHCWLVACDSNDYDKIIGYSHALPNELPIDNSSELDGEIGKLYVLESYQNLGIGKLLLNGIIEWIEKNYTKTIYVSVYSQNPGAIKLYESFGFVKVGEYYDVVREQKDLEFILRRISN